MNIFKAKSKIKRVIIFFLVCSQLLTGFPYDYLVVKSNLLFTKLSLGVRLEPTLMKAKAAVTPKGVMGWGEAAKDDILQFGNYTSPTTYSDIGDSVDVTANTNDVYHVRIATSPTRNEVMAAFIEGDGTLHVTRCVGDCDAAGDWSEELEIASTITTFACDNSNGDCQRPFDIAYEQLSGDFFVFYAKTASAGYIFYNIWNGSSWVGEASYQFNAAGNEPYWIRSVAEGESGSTARKSDRIGVLISETQGTDDFFAAIWSGSAFGNLTQIGSAKPANTLSADAAWESLSGNLIVVYSEAATATDIFQYKEFTNATSTWDTSPTATVVAFTNASVGVWVSLRSHPSSNRIAGAFTNGANDVLTGIWKADGSTEGWTAGTEDTTVEPIVAVGVPIGVAWEHTNGGTPMAMFVKTDASTGDESDYETWISGTGFSGWTDMPGDAGDESNSWKVWGNPNNDEIMAAQHTEDDMLVFQVWSGSAWDADASADIANSDLAPSNIESADEGMSYDFAYRYYSPWGRNWRFYTDVASNTPSTGLANENTNGYITKEQLLRLRLQLRELNGLIGQTDTRKKLQFTSGCNPNTTNEYECSWTDVGDVAATTDVWRYTSQANGDSVCANCNDNTALGSTTLTGSSQSGSFVTDKDAAGGSNMDHNAAAIVEYDYPLKAEAVTAGTTYYFRAVDVDTTNVLQINLRRQDTGTTDCLSATCTYPSVTIDPDMTQNDFEFWVDNDVITPTEVWGNPDIPENTYLNSVPGANDPIDPGDEIRIRMNFTVSTVFAANSRGFILQFAEGVDCTAISSWTDVDVNGGAGVWRYATSTITDNTAIASTLISTSDVLGRYNKSDPTTTNPNSATAGQDVEWDWHLEYNSANAAGARTYCFRMIRDTGIVFETYNADGYPKLDTSPANSELMRHGNFFSSGVEKGFFW